MAAARWAAALVTLGVVVGLAAGPRPCAAQPVVLSSYGQSRLSLKPYDWTYLRGEEFSSELLLLCCSTGALA
jgi:hypothetical protein